jgi:hypothetical protein
MNVHCDDSQAFVQSMFCPRSRNCPGIDDAWGLRIEEVLRKAVKSGRNCSHNLREPRPQRHHRGYFAANVPVCPINREGWILVPFLHRSLLVSLSLSQHASLLEARVYLGYSMAASSPSRSRRRIQAREIILWRLVL